MTAISTGNGRDEEDENDKAGGGEIVCLSVLLPAVFGFMNSFSSLLS